MDVIITECGLANLRGRAPRERAEWVIGNRAHPSYREALLNYYRAALSRSRQTPHLLEEAFASHVRTRETESMQLPIGDLVRYTVT